FPKTARLGMSGFTELLQQINALWKKDRERVLQAGEEITYSLQSRLAPAGPEVRLDLATLDAGYDQLQKSFDARWGGCGPAPKFPTPHHLTFLIRWDRRHPESQARPIVTRTLEAMRCGGVFDHVGLGFHRYSVDAQWLVPHFEKMLYDQALLAMAYTEAYQAWREPLAARVTREIFTYVLRDMTDPEGGFYSAEDADSEGHEGVFYVWTPEEVKKNLGEETGALYCRCYDIKPGGNFEGKSIPNLPLPLEKCAKREGKDPAELEKILEEARRNLFEVRKGRIHPLKDDKILTAWNGLMIAALAKAAQALGEPEFTRAAARSAAFILEKMRDPSGRLYRRFRDGHLANPGYLEDYVYLVWGLIELYEATFELNFLQEAITLNRIAIDLFWDEAEGGFFFTPRDGEPLIAREKEIYDGAVPSGNSVGLLNLLRLGKITGESAWSEKADQLLRNFSAAISGHPMAYTQLLNALDWVVGPSQEIVIAGEPDHPVSREMVRLVREAFLPNKILLFKPTGPAGEALNRLASFVEPMVPA
ncbi:MAG TPA: thioredoxin domain-containing protein, partial [Thermodesulfobacteriota bacterium]|nr:thioredoxin domain-containing protein [Thermodesulfobacteriota bacterium]